LSLAAEVEANKTSEADHNIDDVDIETKVKDYRDV
jgi:hypothetical protein